MHVPFNPLNSFQLILHAIPPNYYGVKFSSAVYYSLPIELRDENKSRLYWNASLFSYDRDEKLLKQDIRDG